MSCNIPIDELAALTASMNLLQESVNKLKDEIDRLVSIICNRDEYSDTTKKTTQNDFQPLLESNGANHTQQNFVQHVSPIINDNKIQIPNSYDNNHTPEHQVLGMCTAFDT